MVESILEKCLGPCGVIGTIEHRLGSWHEEAINTTPGAMKLGELAATMKTLGGRALAMEASSHALDQRRLSGMEITVGVMTNLTQDHLDYHGSMEAYAEAKALLFRDHLRRPTTAGKPDPCAVIIVDDDYCRAIADSLPSDLPLVRLSTQRPVGPGVDMAATDIVQKGSRVRFQAQCRGVGPIPAFDLPVDLPLPGLYNSGNALGAIAAACALGCDPQQVVSALSAMPPVRGRLEPVRAGQAFEVLVDYAHTPDALENSLRNARAICEPGGKLIVVFGCGGDRDKTKRPIMGEIAITLADTVIVTDDNPRTEQSQDIISEILVGIRPRDLDAVHHGAVPDRGTAIRTAISLATTGDVVLIAGKGHETYQEVNGRRTHFDDVEEALLALGDSPWIRTPIP
jgi:UDP-N-acetylmuramyl-tripeptide synthetase